MRPLPVGMISPRSGRLCLGPCPSPQAPPTPRARRTRLSSCPPIYWTWTNRCQAWAFLRVVSGGLFFNCFSGTCNWIDMNTWIVTLPPPPPVLWTNESNFYLQQVHHLRAAREPVVKLQQPTSLSNSQLNQKPTNRWVLVAVD